MEPLLTAPEIAKWLRLNVETVYVLIRQDELPAMRLGGQWRFQQSEVQHWLSSQRNPLRAESDK